MEQLNTVLSFLTPALVAVVAVAVAIGRSTLEAGVKAAAEQGAQTAIKNINWPVELRQELQKSRGVERQELRFQSYGQLWSLLRPLAIYSNEKLDRDDVLKLSDDLSAWYFSACGGMLMTSHVREFYFALQDLVRRVGNAPSDWQSKRTSQDHREDFKGVLERMRLPKALAVLDKLAKVDLANWPPFTTAECEGWRSDIATLGGHWTELDQGERFVVLQQVSSVLRSNLAHDVESRLR